MTTNKTQNDYDLIKGMLNKVRKIQSIGESNKGQRMINEQTDSEEGDDFQNLGNSVGKYMDQNNDVQDPTIKRDPGEEQEDIAVINHVEIEIHSEDPEDLELNDNEKTSISQLIDEFRSEVSELTEFDRLHIYPDTAKLDGKLTDLSMNFSLSTGDDRGLYITNASMLKIDDDSLDMINKLKAFEGKFANTINNLLVNRSNT